MKAIVLLLVSLATTLAQAQVPGEDTTLVRYQGGFTFREGLYFTFDAFRHNRPSVPKEQLTTDQGQHVGDLRSTNGKVFFPDSTGQRKRLDLDRLWGFCDNGVVYVHAGNGFSRIGLMGSISHLTFDATYRDWGAYGMYGSTYTVEEQRFLDMDGGAFLPVSAGGLRQVLARDAVLVEEFDALSKKERNKDGTLFLFMRRYNDRHPLYFPR